MVASTLDPILRSGGLREVIVAGEPRNSSLSLMIAWLRLRLDEPVTRVDEEGVKGISSITARTADGDVVIARHDLEKVMITRPGAPEPQAVTMARREPVSTLNEELRRLTPDLVYQEVLATLLEEPTND